MLKISFLLVLLFFATFADAQNKDQILHKELLNRLDIGDSDIVSINIAFELYDITFVNNPSKATEYAALAVQIANHLKDSVLIGQSKMKLGQSYLMQKNYFMATRLFFDSYLIFIKQDNSDSDLAYTLLLWAKVYANQNNFDIAKPKIVRALEIFRYLGDSTGVAKTFNVIGEANINVDDDKAVDYFLKALNIFSFLKDDYNSALTYNLLAISHLNLGKSDIAIDYLMRSIFIFKKNDNLIDLADTYLILGDNFYYEELYEKSIDYYLKSISIYNQLNYNIKIAENNFKFASSYIGLRNYDSAKVYAKKVLDYSMLFNDLDLQTKTYKILKDIAIAEKDNQKILYYSDLYENTLIAFYEDQSLKNFSSFEMNIETSQYDKEIELLKVKSDKEKLQLFQNQYKRNRLFGIIILVLALGFLVFIYIRFRERKKTAYSLEKTNKKLQQEIDERKKAELKAISNEKRYKLLFSESPIGILQYDDNMIISDVNNRFAEIFNSKPDDIIDKHINRIFDRKTVNLVANLLYSESKKLIKIQSEIPTKKGVIYVSLTVKKYKIKSNKKELTGGIIIIEDLTEQKQTERFYKQDILSKQKLLTKIPDDIILIDRNEKIIEIHFPDFPEKELKVTKLADIFDEDTLSVFRTHIVKVESSQNMSQFSFENKNKKYLVRVFVSGEGYLILIGNFIGNFDHSAGSINNSIDSNKKTTKDIYIKHIKDDIEKELLPIYQNIQRGLSFIMIKNFAEKIVSLGEKNENQKIIEFGEQLLDYVTNFNVMKVNEQLENFPTFISHFLGFGIKL